MLDLRISYGILFHIDAVIYRKTLPPCCFLFILGFVSILEFEVFSCRIEVYKYSMSVKYIGVIVYRTVCITLVSRVLIRNSIDNIFREDISDEIEHLSIFRLLKIVEKVLVS